MHMLWSIPVHHVPNLDPGPGPEARPDPNTPVLLRKLHCIDGLRDGTDLGLGLGLGAGRMIHLCHARMGRSLTLTLVICVSFWQDRG